LTKRRKDGFEKILPVVVGETVAGGWRPVPVFTVNGVGMLATVDVEGVWIPAMGVEVTYGELEMVEVINTEERLVGMLPIDIDKVEEGSTLRLLEDRLVKTPELKTLDEEEEELRTGKWVDVTLCLCLLVLVFVLNRVVTEVDTGDVWIAEIGSEVAEGELETREVVRAEDRLVKTPPTETDRAEEESGLTLVEEDRLVRTAEVKKELEDEEEARMGMEVDGAAGEKLDVETVDGVAAAAEPDEEKNNFTELVSEINA
jgi:hypothetical protein